MKFNLLFLILIFAFFAQAQDSISIQNASFEGEELGSPGTIPQGWIGCKMGTTPDIMPGVWGVLTPPSHGQGYIGLITREDGSNESIGQRLVTPLASSTCYRFTIDLAHSSKYFGYNLPACIRIWGGIKSCKYEQLLWQSSLINNQNWETHPVQFITKDAYRFITIEAYFAPGVFLKYRGNILIDNISEIISCDRA